MSSIQWSILKTRPVSCYSPMTVQRSSRSRDRADHHYYSIQCFILLSSHAEVFPTPLPSLHLHRLVHGVLSRINNRGVNAGTSPAKARCIGDWASDSTAENQYSARDQRVYRRKSALPPTPAINHKGNPAAIIGLLLTRSKARMETRSNYQP